MNPDLRNFNLSHHPNKANVVVDALSRKPSYRKCNGYRDLRDSSLVYEVTLKSMKLVVLKTIGLKIRTDEVMRFYDKIHVIVLRMLILQRGLSSGLSVQLGAIRTHQNLREIFGWFGLKEKWRTNEPNCLAYLDQFYLEILREFHEALESNYHPSSVNHPILRRSFESLSVKTK
ncbi:hypothetical protein CR513_46290, partial [Mucuna pruriens]